MSSSVLKRNNVQVVGSGTRTLIFAHGFGSDQTAWKPLVATFQSSHRIILFDHVGSGRSDFSAYSPHRYRSLHAYAEDLLEICAELKVRESVLVGHSVSGMVSLLASLVEPRYFRQLVFLKASPRYLNDGDYRGGFTQAQLDEIYAAMSSNFYAWASGFAPLAMNTPDRPELVQEFVRTLSAMRPDIAQGIARVIFQSDHRADLPRAKVPVLILQSGGDIAVPNEVGEYMARHIPRARLVPIEAQGHLPHMSAPEAVCRALEPLLAMA